MKPLFNYSLKEASVGSSPTTKKKTPVNAKMAAYSHNAKMPAKIKNRDQSLMSDIIQAGEYMQIDNFDTVSFGHGWSAPRYEFDSLKITIETKCYYVSADAEAVVDQLYPTIKRLAKKYGFNYIYREKADGGHSEPKHVQLTFKTELNDLDRKYYKFEKI